MLPLTFVLNVLFFKHILKIYGERFSLMRDVDVYINTDMNVIIIIMIGTFINACLK